LGWTRLAHAAAIGADKIDPGALPWLVGAFSSPRRPELPSANRLSWRSYASALRRALSSDGLRQHARALFRRLYQKPSSDFPNPVAGNIGVFTAAFLYQQALSDFPNPVAGNIGVFTAAFLYHI
jgi:hypothetical protein